MKKLITTMFVVLSFTAILFAAEKFVIEDGSTGKNQATCGGWWYTYNDAESGGNSEVLPQPQAFEKTKDGAGFVARMKGKTGNKLGWDFIGMGVTLSEKSGCPGGAVPVDLSKYTTLSFKIKGEISGGRFTVIIPYMENKCEEGKYGLKTLTDWADYEVGISPKVTKDWTTVKIDLRKDLKQPKWAKKQVSIDDVLKNAHNINWHFSSPDGDTIDVSIKDVELN
ncbi:MAG TPA: hypothetical protein PLF61_04245 [Candidatus Goldiibacteriota bacterium]|nr:hypothetical protein [Candidatus Goldiibacteriota bacterium]